MTPLLTVCVLTRDESATLARALRSVRHVADEVVVYDTGSTDDTLLIAGAAGARAISGPWPDSFAVARNAALAHCQGSWVLVLDADEELQCPDPVALRDALASAAPETLAFELTIDNDLRSGVAAAYAAVAPRLVRRERAEWRGRLNEQLVDVRSGAPERGTPLRAARVVHHGDRSATLADRRKLERNLALAQAEVDHPALGDRGAALVALGRALWRAGRPSEALRPLLEGARTTADPRAQRRGYGAAVRVLLSQGRLEEAGESLGLLYEASTSSVTADVLACGLALARRNYGLALSRLPPAHASVRDDDGDEHTPVSLAEWRSAALLGLGRCHEAATLLLDLVAQGFLAADLDLVLETLERAGRPVHDLARVLPRELRAQVIAEALHLSPTRADAVMEALWAAGVAANEDRSLVRAASSVGRLLDVDDAARWSARVRGAGHAELCPLVAQAADCGLPPARRARAALVAIAAFEEKVVVPDLEATLAALDPPRLDDLLAGEHHDLVEHHLSAARALAEPSVRRRGGDVEPVLSVIVLARGGPETVLAGLGMLAATLPHNLSFEIIVVDTASTDATPIVANGVRGDVVSVRTECALGAAAARNLGAEVARGEILVFLDATVHPRRGWLALCVQRLQDRPRTGAVAPVLVDRAGRVLAAGASAQLGRRPAPPASGLAERPWGSPPDDLAVRVSWLGRPSEVSPHERDESRGGPLLPGWALAVRASAFAAVGGFHPGYWAGGEGFDLSLALQQDGWTTACDRHASVALPDPFDPGVAPWAAIPLGSERTTPGSVQAAATDDEALFLARWSAVLPHHHPD